jgi:hypothetical protein
MATYLPNITDAIPEPALFTPDFSFLDTMLRRRQGLYEQGFAQVNSAYNFLNRDVTQAYNAQTKQRYLNEARSRLKNLSAMDLSQRQNVSTATGVFEPFYKNSTLLGDQALTAHWNQQLSVADSYRLQDGGKEFHEDNAALVRMQQEKFRNDTPDSWQRYYGNREYYTPFYDADKEMIELMKNFKPSSTKIERVNGMYMVTTKDASWTKEEISRYLNATLSEKAKKQLGIHAKVRYSDPAAVAGLYVNQAQMELPVIEQKISDVNASIKSERNKEKLEQLKSLRETFVQNRNEIASNLESISKGDISFLQGNAEKFARNVYMSQAVDRIAKGFSHKDIEQTIDANQVAMMYARMAFDRAENEKNRKAQQGTELPIVPVTREGETVTTSYSTLQNDIKNAKKVSDAKFNELKDYMTTQDAFRGRSSASITGEEVQKWVSSHQQNEKVIAFVNAETVHSAKNDQLTNWQKGAEQWAVQQMGSEYDQLLTYREEQKKLENKAVNNITGTQTMTVNGRTFQVPSSVIPAGKDKYYFERGPYGKSRYDIDKDLAKAGSKMVARQQTGINGEALEKKFTDLKKQYNSKQNTVEVSKNTQGFTLSTDDKRYKSAVGYLESISGADGMISGVKWFPTLEGFDMTFKLNDADKTNPKDREKLRNDLISTLGTNQVTYNKDTDVFTVGNLAPTISPRLDPYGGIPPVHRQALSSIEGLAGQPGMTRSTVAFPMTGKAGTHAVQVVKLFGTTPESDSYILYMNNKSIDRPYSSPLDAYGAAFGLVNNPVALSTVLSGN